MARTEHDRLQETKRKMELALAYLQEAIMNRAHAKTWGRISVIAVVEGGYIKEIHLDDNTVVRDLPTEKIAIAAPNGLDKR